MKAVFRDPAHQREFEDRGYVVVKLLDSPEVERLLGFFERYASEHQTAFSATMLSGNFDYRCAAAVEVQSVMKAPLAELLQDYATFTGSYVVKGPRQPDAWLNVHQDLSFTDEDVATAINNWCPLVDVGPENGWLGVVPGSHRYNPNFREPGAFAGLDLMSEIKSDHLHFLEMKAGEAVLYHPRLLHGSPGNRTDQMRTVAVTTSAPVGADLIYCHLDREKTPDRLEVYSVEPDFYVSHRICARPECEHSRFLRDVPRVVEALTMEKLESWKGTSGRMGELPDRLIGEFDRDLSGRPRR